MSNKKAVAKHRAKNQKRYIQVALTEDEFLELLALKTINNNGDSQSHFNSSALMSGARFAANRGNRSVDLYGARPSKKNLITKTAEFEKSELGQEILKKRRY